VAADPEYRKMMKWVAIALVGTVIAALVIVELVMRTYGP
jgi:ABC-type phosphate/phosphonate transport system permease subunit